MRLTAPVIQLITKVGDVLTLKYDARNRKQATGDVITKAFFGEVPVDFSTERVPRKPEPRPRASRSPLWSNTCNWS
jgi:hypothetical protein